MNVADACPFPLDLLPISKNCRLDEMGGGLEKAGHGSDDRRGVAFPRRLRQGVQFSDRPQQGDLSLHQPCHPSDFLPGIRLLRKEGQFTWRELVPESLLLQPLDEVILGDAVRSRNGAVQYNRPPCDLLRGSRRIEYCVIIHSSRLTVVSGHAHRLASHCAAPARARPQNARTATTAFVP